MFRTPRLRRASRPAASLPTRFRPQLEVLEERQLLTAVPTLLKDLRLGSSDGNPAGFTQVGSTIYFSADDKLWKTDGTTAGTVELLDDAELGSMAELNGKLIFSGPGQELWTSDGTPEGTSLLIDLNPNGGSGFNHNSGPTEFTNINGTMFFAALHPTYGFELWKTDGTATGTELVADTSSLGATQNRYLRSFTNVNGTLFFRQHDGVHGWELWKSDGTAAGTMMVADINPNGDATPAALTVVDNKLYFSADDGVHGIELWTSDGTPGGTEMVADINPGSGSSATHAFSGHSIADVDGTVYLAANDGTHGLELWKSDGTTANTQLVKDINPGAAGAFRENATPMLLEYQGALVMVANDGTTGSELWKSDGSAAGTQLVKDIWPGPESRISEMINGNGILYLSADEGTLGRELWISDSTASGTYLLSDVYPGATESLVNNLTYFQNGLLFAGYGPSIGRELWIVPGLFVDLDNTTVESGSRAVWYDSPVPIAAPTATIDYWGSELISMSAMLSAPLDGDVLAADTSGTAITAAFDGTTLLLSGADTLANYQQVLRSITYHNTLGRPPAIHATTVLVSARDAQNTPTNVATATIILNEQPAIDLNGPGDGSTYSTTWANAPRPMPPQRRR